MKNLKPKGKLIEVLLGKNKAFLKNIVFDTIVGKKIRAYTPNQKWCLLQVETVTDIIYTDEGIYIYVKALSSTGLEYNYIMRFEDYIYD